MAAFTLFIKGDTDLQLKTSTSNNLIKSISDPLRDNSEQPMLLVNDVILENKLPRRSTSRNSSYGTLINGQKYQVLHYLIYWDGFSMNTSTYYNTASGDGLYISWLNTPAIWRQSDSSVRMLSMIPPGVRIGQVRPLLKTDIRKGLSTGFSKTDHSGISTLLFLNPVGAVADSPAIHDVLHTMTHTAGAPCHKCSFRAFKSSRVSSRYYRFVDSFKRTGKLRTWKKLRCMDDRDASDQDLNYHGFAHDRKHFIELRKPYDYHQAKYQMLTAEH